MKRALALLLALVLVTSAGAVYAAKELEAPADQVVFTEQTLYGDLHAADGLQIRKQEQLGGNLVWDSTIDFSGSGFTDTTEHLYVNDVWNDPRYQKPGFGYNGITIYSELNNSYEGDGGAYMYMSEGLTMAQNELIAETPKGAEKEKILRMTDYFQYYPLMIDIQLPSILYGMYPEMIHSDENESREIYAIRTIQEFFRIPLLNNEQYKMGIEKDEDGNVVRAWGGSLEEGDFYPVNCFSVASDKACYFYISNRTANGNPVDTSLIPGGYGIYILPYGQTETKGDDGTHYGYDVFVDELRVFYPLDPQTRILEMALSEDQKTLLLHTEENGKHVVTVIQAENGEISQRFELADYSEDSICEIVSVKDTFIVRIDTSYSVLNRKSEKEWELLYQTVPTEMEKNESFIPLHGWYEHKYAFDGERMAVVAHEIVSNGRGDSCSFVLAVYNKEGLQYYGTYESSLDKANAPAEVLSGSGFNRIMNLNSEITWKK